MMMHYAWTEKTFVVHYNFDGPDTIRRVTRLDPKPSPVPNRWFDGELFSTSPANAFYLTTEGGGAEGTPGYLALPAEDSDQFYIESTPVWWTPSTTFDLRQTEVSFYLRELQTITVASGYAPYLFTGAYVGETKYISCWRRLTPLVVGQNEWALNRLVLVPDESLWLNYGCTHPDDRPSLECVLSRCGFIGVMYQNGSSHKGVHATGVLGLDEFRYNIPL
jgi:hypothetical protein